MGLRADLNDVERRKFLTLAGLELRPLGHPARSQSLCRLHYPGSLKGRNKGTKKRNGRNSYREEKERKEKGIIRIIYFYLPSLLYIYLCI
jgi:hypothetical protein